MSSVTLIAQALTDYNPASSSVLPPTQGSAKAVEGRLDRARQERFRHLGRLAKPLKGLTDF